MDDRREEDRLDERDLAAWRAADPPEGFADRVLAARRAGEPVPEPAAANRGRRLGLSALVALAAAAAIALLWRAGGEGAAAEGELRARARASAEIGGRGTAVAEADSALSWRVSPQGAAVIQQERGDVFYRADPGGPFTVETPAGRVIVTGTCFRVEVGPMKPKKHAAVGATPGAAAVITVYEGSVLFANDKGSVEVAAGQSATASREESPALRSAGDGAEEAGGP